MKPGARHRNIRFHIKTDKLLSYTRLTIKTLQKITMKPFCLFLLFICFFASFIFAKLLLSSWDLLQSFLSPCLSFSTFFIRFSSLFLLAISLLLIDATTPEHLDHLPVFYVIRFSLIFFVFVIKTWVSKAKSLSFTPVYDLFLRKFQDFILLVLHSFNFLTSTFFFFQRSQSFLDWRHH